MNYRRDRKGSMDMLTVRNEAQKIAFAPMIFQATLSLLDLGILQAIDDGMDTADKIAAQTGISEYGVSVLTDIAIYAGILSLHGDGFKITKIGRCLMEDEVTRVNLHFINDVCYQGAFYLKESIQSGAAEGLKVFGDWSTVYEGLRHLPKNVRKSWFDFDNYYSDISFEEAISILLRQKPKMVYDVGANTGKFGKMLLSMDDEVQLHCFDLPGQIVLAEANIANAKRASFTAIDILKAEAVLPIGADAVWMSQFLDCFSPEYIISILKKAAAALAPAGRIFILEPFI
ncbi:MAG: SAM-dependent methyltransferase, partial [Deferribacteraceae bacterium]|nr:SAM-dependent methyltransferase [Deferribacteraceae bacterium]